MSEPAESRSDPPVRAGTAPPLRLRHGPGADDLTTLVARHLSRARRLPSALTLLSVSLEHTSTPFVTQAHAMDVAVVADFGRRLRARLRATDDVWQTQDREFVAALPGCRPDGAFAVRRRLFAALGEPYRVDEALVMVTTRIGLACFPAMDGSAEDLLAAAQHSRDIGERQVPARRA